MWMRPSHFRAFRGRIEQVLTTADRQTPVDARQIQLDAVAHNYQAMYFHTLRARRAGEWSPALRLSGREHIEQALAAGKGAILWVYPLAYYTLFAKMALSKTGFPPVHLSRPGHGFSDSRFGVRYLNPILTKAEDPYIAERVVVRYGHETKGLRTLIKQLRQNRVLTITGSSEGRKVLTPPFFDGTLRLATGAPNLALSTGAALLPTMTVREPSGEYVVYVEPALQPPDDGTSKDNGEAMLAHQFASVLENYVRRYPDQWEKWSDSRLWPA